MTQIIRTNLATNPNVATNSTNWSAVAGTGGVANGLGNAGTGSDGTAGFFRTTWTTATTATSGGFDYTQTGLSALTVYQISVWIRSNRTQRIRMSVDFKNSSNVVVNNVFDGNKDVTLVANTWTQLTLTARSGAAVDRAVVHVFANSGGGGFVWAVNDTLDGDSILLEARPTVRTNLISNPDIESNTTGFAAGTSCSITQKFDRYHSGTASLGITTTASVADASASYSITLAANTVYTLSYWAYSVAARTVTFDAGTKTGIGSQVSLPAGVWTRVWATFTTPATAPTSIVLHHVGAASSGAVVWCDDFLLEQSDSLGAQFSGDTASTSAERYMWTGLAHNSQSVAYTPPATSYAYFDGNGTDTPTLIYAWSGTVNGSTSTETVLKASMTADALVDEPCPRIRLTIVDIGSAPVTYQIKRLCEGETQVLQGWYSTAATDSAVVLDFAAPLGRNITYYLCSNGTTVASLVARIDGITSCWIQDPLLPDGAIECVLDGSKLGALCLDADSLQEITYKNSANLIYVAGDKYPRVMGGQRQAATGVPLTLWADDQATADNFRNMMQDATILLFRPAASISQLPPTSYLAADVKERPTTQPFGGETTEWLVTGDLVAAVIQAALSGQVTYQQVQDLLGAYTYAEIQTKAAGTTYLDWQKDPLIWRTL